LHLLRTYKPYPVLCTYLKPPILASARTVYTTKNTERQRRKVGKLHNLVAHVIASKKRTDLFTELQKEYNTGIVEGKR